MKTKVTSLGDVKVGSILNFKPNKEDILYTIWRGIPLYKDEPSDSFGIDLIHRTNQPFIGLVLQKKLLPNFKGREPALHRFVLKLLIDGHIRYIFAKDITRSDTYEFYLLTHD